MIQREAAARRHRANGAQPAVVNGGPSGACGGAAPEKKAQLQDEPARTLKLRQKLAKEGTPE